MAMPLKDFVDALTASGLMTADQLREFRAQLPAEHRHLTTVTLAELLVQRDRLTVYQAKRICDGRPYGLILGNYVILNHIATGGMGEVYRAEHRRMKRQVVIKILPEERTKSEAALKRFQREVEAAAQLHHPNIVTAFDADESDGIYYLVMEYVQGEDLGSLVARTGALPARNALDYTIQAARGLAYAHAAGIIHRDIKPANLLVDTKGVVKVLDMGLARFDQAFTVRPDSQDEDSLTQANQIVGTVEYMSPEQADDSAHVDRRSDIYSLGCTMFRLLTARLPFSGESTIKKLLAHRTDPIPSICEACAGVPILLDDVFERMVAKDPEDRYPSMDDVIAGLEKCLQLLGHSNLAGVGGAGGTAPSRLPTGEATQNAAEDTSFPSPRGQVLIAPRAIGIDLGTTFSVVAYVDARGRPVTVNNAEGDKTTPSVLLFDEEGVIVGKEAIKAMASDMEFIAECVKRELGAKQYHRSMHGVSYPPEVLQAWILNKLRLDASKVIGPFEKVVITVPAYFDEVRRKATQDAGYMAGFEVIDIINEPTAAALAFAFESTEFTACSQDGRRRNILVYDLGGGTFDVTVMEIRGNHFKTLATDGDVRLGGRDWDQRLIDYVSAEFIREFGIDPREEPNSMGRLLRECEEAKRSLSARQRAHILCDSHSRSKRITVTRSEFNAMTQDLLERTVFTTQQTLRAAGLTWSDLDRVLLVGGATRIPAVKEALRELSGQEPDASVSADEAVAHGAALRAGMLRDEMEGKTPRIKIQNVNSHSLGIAGVDPRTRRPQTAVLIRRNSTLPCAAHKVFNTSKANQTSILIKIVEGESESPDDCVQIGKCVVRNLPPGLPAQTPVEVRFRYEQNGRLTVHVRVAGTKTRLQHEIRREKGLTPEKLNEWRQHISGLPPLQQELSESARSTRIMESGLPGNG